MLQLDGCMRGSQKSLMFTAREENLITAEIQYARAYPRRIEYKDDTSAIKAKKVKLSIITLV